MTAELEYHIWKLLEQINKVACPICAAYPGTPHRDDCDFWDKLKLMREIVHDNGDDRGL
jgi:hypothetical protein